MHFIGIALGTSNKTRRLLGLATTAAAHVLILLAPLARAADALSYGPPPAWVTPQQAPTTASKDPDAPVQGLLSDVQVRLAPVVSESYFDSIVKIQTPRGLSMAGNIALTWRPETDVVTVHRLRILREDQEIDVLGSGQKFAILRREEGLEYATLSGVLTAAIQPEGLRVGDRLELAYTLKRTDALLGGVPEGIFAFQAGPPSGRMHLTVRWPSSYRMTWQASKFLDGMQERSAGSEREVSATFENLTPLIQPAGAPARFAAVRMLQVSGYRSWSELSRRLFPLFEQASRIPRDSPLQAEIEGIRRRAPDDRGRAELALRLVQDEIRYVYIGLSDARLVPADVASTWTRRYGDCKAKTALLLGILRELGIPAQAVLVSTLGGDALPDRLPMLEVFNHVLVRATIAGRTYWLDGSRTGDRHLDDIPPLTYRWGLPLTAPGDGLVAIEAPPPHTPLSETTIFVDASAGPTSKAAFRAEMVLRSDAATLVQNALSRLSDTQRDQALRSYWRKQSYWSDNWDDLTLKTVKAEFDDDQHILRLTLEGEGMMNWQGDEHLIGSVSLGAAIDLHREPGPNSDAPYLTSFPVYVRTTEHIKLPSNGAGYDIVGDDFDRTIAGVHYSRKAAIVNGELTAEATMRSLALEFPAAEAAAAQKSLRELWDHPLYAKLPTAPALASATSSSESSSSSPSGACPAMQDGDPAGASDPGRSISRSEIDLLHITPAEGTTVRKETVLVVDLSYAASDFKPDRFKILAQFDTQRKGWTSDGTFKSYPILKTAAGKLRFCFPLTDVWDEPKIRFPLTVRFYLNRILDDGRSSTVVATTQAVTFPAEGQPASPAR